MWIYLIGNFEPFQQCHKFLLDVRLLNIEHFTSGRKEGKANLHELNCIPQEEEEEDKEHQEAECLQGWNTIYHISS